MKHVMLKFMYVQDVVEKKLKNLVYINTKQKKADLMTKCHHTRSTQEVLYDDRIETRLKQNRGVTEQREDETKKRNVKRSQSPVMKKK